MPLWQSILLFGIPAIIFYIVTHHGIAWLVAASGMPLILSWFLLGGIFIFIPLFIIAILGVHLDGFGSSFHTLRARLRLKPMNKGDWLWTIGAIVIIAAATCLVHFFGTWLSEVSRFIPAPSTEVPFMNFHGFEEGQYWLFIVWLPFFFFNIFGEELLWRGYILPRQEMAHGNWAWLINCLLWVLFHACFGWGMIIFLLPLLAGIPYVVQKRKNTSIGIILHAIVNGGGFISVALKGV